MTHSLSLPPWLQPLTSLLKDMLSEVRQAISEKKAELENLPLLHSRVDLMCYNRCDCHVTLT